MELVIKKSVGKLPDFLPDIVEVVKAWLNNGFEILPLSEKHIFSYQSIPLDPNHKDPFDRFLIAIAKEENFVIITEDSKFQLYNSIISLA